MSASLVGSEMCIRDSRPPFGQLRAASGHARALSGRLGRSPKRHEERPVSYTHLTLPTICSV
eukprot:13140408-Alexandrium_andersonii.AAC.1